MNHKTYLLRGALKCSYKLQKIQSLEKFVSMVIQGTKLPMYTKHTLFLYFYNFSIFVFLFLWKKNLAKLKTNRQKHVKTKHSIKLD